MIPTCSDKPVIEYDGFEVWADQIADFCRQIVGLDKPVTLVGNSLGGYSVVAAVALHVDLRRAADLVLLNSAGRFDADSPEELPPDALAEAGMGAAAAESGSLLARIWDSVVAALRRGVVAASFIFAKQPARIRQVSSCCLNCWACSAVALL